jgi:hypothetical protein
MVGVKKLVFTSAMFCDALTVTCNNACDSRNGITTRMSVVVFFNF